MPTSTTRYSFQKPTVGGDTDNWGTLLNENWDSADSNLYSVQTTANAALPKAGGEMTGDITFDSDASHDIGTSSKAAQKIYSDAVQTDTITNQATSGGLTVDVDGDIVLDADGGDLEFKDAGTSILKISNSSSDVVVQPQVADKDIIFKEDGGTEIARFDSSAQSLKLASGKKVEFADTGEHISSNGTDLTLAAGADINLTATTDINIPADVGITFGNDGEKIEGDGTDLTVTSSNDLTLDAAGDITLSADGDQVKMDDGTTTRFQVDTASGDVTMTDSDAGTALGPELKLHRNSASPGDDDVLGAVTFAGEAWLNVGRSDQRGRLAMSSSQLQALGSTLLQWYSFARSQAATRQRWYSSSRLAADWIASASDSGVCSSATSPVFSCSVDSISPSTG